MDKSIQAHRNADEIAELLEPPVYTGECAAIASEQAARARDVASGLEDIDN